MTRLPAALALLFVAACSSEPEPEPLPFEPAGPNAAPDASTFGPFPVGVRTVTIEDPFRAGADGKMPRKLVTEIWYPAVEAARGRPGVSYDIRTQLTAEQQEQTAHLTVPLLETPAVRDAAPRSDRGTFPLVIFSHGQGGIRWQSTFYTVALASHGYVVASTDHPGNTLAEALQDKLQDGGTQIDQRPKDVSWMLDVLLDTNDVPFLSGLLDREKIGVTGHSFGAITSIRTAAFDDRVKAIVPQTPGFTDLALVGLPEDFKLSIPSLVQASKRDRTLDWEENIPYTWTRFDGPRAFFDLVTGGHFTYSDLCRFDLGAIATEINFDDVADVLEDGCGPDAPQAEVALPLINQFAVGFFNAVLRGSTGSLAQLTQEKADARAQGVAEVQVHLEGLK